MTSYKIKGAACSILYCENHHLPTMLHTVVVVYTLEYNCRASYIHGYKLLDVIVQATYTIALLWFIELYT